MPRRDEIEAVAEVAEEGDADGVGRRAVDREGQRPVGEGPLADAKRAHQRLLVADRALVRVGRDDRDVAHRLERLLEREQAARFDAVVVGDRGSAAGSSHSASGRAVVAREATAAAAACRAAGQRLAALLVEVPPLGPGPLAGHVRASSPARRRPPVGRRRPLMSGSVAGVRLIDVGGRARRGLARDADRPALAFGQPLRRPPGDGAVAGRPVEELEEERRDDGGDRDAEDGARDARDPRSR